jgi:hypothetical protein
VHRTRSNGLLLLLLHLECPLLLYFLNAPLPYRPLGWLHDFTAVMLFYGLATKVNPPALQESVERYCVIIVVLSTVYLVWKILICAGADAYFEVSSI